MSNGNSFWLDLEILMRTPLAVPARPECGVMRSSPSVPAAFEAAHAPASHANDPYGEVLVGGIKTACLSRADLTRMMLADCFAARRMEIPGPSWSSPSTAMPLRWRRPRRKIPPHLRKRRHHPCRWPGRRWFASRLLTGTPIPERSATTDFIHDAAKAAAEQGLRFFLFGATEEANEKAARALTLNYPGLQIAGRRHGYFSLLDEDDICDEINITRPDVIWLGLSVPLNMNSRCAIATACAVAGL